MASRHYDPVSWTVERTQILIELRALNYTPREIAFKMRLKPQQVYFKLRNLHLHPEQENHKRPRETRVTRNGDVMRPADLPMADIVVEVVSFISRGRNLDDVARLYHAPIEEIRHNVVQRNQNVARENRIYPCKPFSPPRSHVAIRATACKVEHLIQYLRSRALNVRVNDLSGHVYFEGEPLSKEQLLYLANSQRQQEQKPLFSILV